MFENLTPRQREVANAILRGNTNQEIAAAARLSVGTVKTHIYHVYLKLGIRSRCGLFKRALDAGVLKITAKHKNGTF